MSSHRNLAAAGVAIATLAWSQAASAYCPCYTPASSSNTHNCGVDAANGQNPSIAEWNDIFDIVSRGPAVWGDKGPSVMDIGQGCGKPEPNHSVPARFPCELLKGIAKQESGWRQFCVPDTPSDQVGGPSRTIISFDPRLQVEGHQLRRRQPAYSHRALVHRDLGVQRARVRQQPQQPQLQLQSRRMEPGQRRRSAVPREGLRLDGALPRLLDGHGARVSQSRRLRRQRLPGRSAGAQLRFTDELQQSSLGARDDLQGRCGHDEQQRSRRLRSDVERGWRERGDSEQRDERCRRRRRRDDGWERQRREWRSRERRGGWGFAREL